MYLSRRVGGKGDVEGEKRRRTQRRGKRKKRTIGRGEGGS